MKFCSGHTTMDQSLSGRVSVQPPIAISQLGASALAVRIPSKQSVKPSSALPSLNCNFCRFNESLGTVRERWQQTNQIRRQENDSVASDTDTRVLTTAGRSLHYPDTNSTCWMGVSNDLLLSGLGQERARVVGKTRRATMGPPPKVPTRQQVHADDSGVSNDTCHEAKP
ncbi:hypothetical protein FB45DRAFT_997195 [Roridomyces roridus]|uniref:Uncharacterized protein n=1 Tax=Roridomyces roridus TaxID=1738132 RepID=A0AAD7CJ43_9AGAR|nr:hypothetical protein FB45DRAFT_997195 [Roridomyces roridus]